MTDTIAFERGHNIVIDATPAAVLDYVSNPQTWPEWLAASHRMDSPARPLVKGDTFFEQWHTGKGLVTLAWTVTDSAPARLWVGETHTDFIGPIVVRYDVETVEEGCRFTRTVITPDRPKPPTDEMIAHMDAEAETALANIKHNVEALGVSSRD